VRFGSPLRFPRGTDYAAAAQRIRTEIESLLEEAGREG